MKNSSTKSNEILKSNLEPSQNVETNLTKLESKQSESNEKETQTDLNLTDINNIIKSSSSSLHTHREPNKIKFSNLNSPKPIQIELTKSYYARNKIKTVSLQNKTTTPAANYSFNPAVSSTPKISNHSSRNSNLDSSEVVINKSAKDLKVSQSIEDNINEFKVTSLKLFQKNISAPMNEIPILKKDNNILFKSLIIDLKQNEIKMVADLSENNDLNVNNEISNNIKVTETTSSNHDDYKPEELIKNEFAKSFIEKFFDRQLNSTDNSSENTMIENSVLVNDVKPKKEDESENEIKKENDVDVYVDNFLDNFFNSKLNLNQSKNDKKSSKKTNKNDSVKLINPTFDEKLDYLKSFVTDDEILFSVLTSYTKAYDLLYNSTLNSSNLVDDNVLLMLKLQRNCSCILNGMKCCLETIFTAISSENVNLPDNFKEYLCCSSCKPIVEQHVNEVVLDESNLSQKEKDQFRKKFFCSSSVETDEEKDEKKTIRNEQPISNNGSFKNSLQINKNASLINASIETPRKTIIKKANAKINDQAHKKNSARKSVHFIEDEKYGFLPIEVPEWQENFREPVYSGKFRKNLPEWKA